MLQKVLKGIQTIHSLHWVLLLSLFYREEAAKGTKHKGIVHIPLWQHLFANFQQKHLGKTDGPTAVLRQETSLSCAVLRPQRSTDFPSFDSFQPNFCLFRLYLENITFYLSFQGNLSCFNNFTQFLGIVQKYNLYAIYFCFLLVAHERIPHQIIHEILSLIHIYQAGS